MKTKRSKGLGRVRPIVLSDGRGILDHGFDQLWLFQCEIQDFFRSQLKRGLMATSYFVAAEGNSLRFLTWMGEKKLNISPWNISTRQLLSWIIAYGKERNLGDVTVRFVLVFFRKFYRFHRSQRTCGVDPSELYGKDAVSRPRILKLTTRRLHTAIGQLISADDVCCDSLAVLLALGANTGARPEELMGLQFGRLKFSGKICELSLQSKREAPRTLYVTGHLARVLKSISIDQKPDAFVFGNIVRMDEWMGHPAPRSFTKKCLHLVLGKEFELRDLRRLYATLYARRRLDPLTLMRILGHGKLSVTDTYVHSLDLQTIRKYGRFIEEMVK